MDQRVVLSVEGVDRADVGLLPAAGYPGGISQIMDRITATVDDIAYADKEVLELEKRLFPNRADQDFYCKFVQPAGRLVDPALLERMVNHNIEPIDLDRYRKRR